MNKKRKFNQPIPEEVRDKLVHAYSDAHHANYVYKCMISDFMMGENRLDDFWVGPMPYKAYKNLSLEEKEKLINQRDAAISHFENYLNEYSEYFTDGYRNGIEAIIDEIKNKVDTGEKE